MTSALHSMTGFARVEVETASGTLAWELRAVNHRYLDVQFRLPEPLRRFEHDLRKQVSAALARGKLDCTLTLMQSDDEASPIRVDAALLRKLRDAIFSAEKAFGDLQPPSAIDLLRWPGVMLDAQDVDEDAAGDLSRSLAEALAALTAMRASEGLHLAELLRTRCDDIDALANTVRARRPAVIAAIQARLRERLARLDVSADPARLETELVILAQKMDVDEELDRLAAHTVELRTIIGVGGPCGRKLDFLIQELNREANTLGSKAADAETTRAAVDMKVAIEQMREQVQNIE